MLVHIAHLATRTNQLVLTIIISFAGMRRTGIQPCNNCNYDVSSVTWWVAGPDIPRNLTQVS